MFDALMQKHAAEEGIFEMSMRIEYGDSFVGMSF